MSTESDAPMSTPADASQRRFQEYANLSMKASDKEILIRDLQMELSGMYSEMKTLLTTQMAEMKRAQAAADAQPSQAV